MGKRKLRSHMLTASEVNRTLLEIERIQTVTDKIQIMTLVKGFPDLITLLSERQKEIFPLAIKWFRIYVKIQSSIDPKNSQLIQLYEKSISTAITYIIGCLQFKATDVQNYHYCLLQIMDTMLQNSPLFVFEQFKDFSNGTIACLWKVISHAVDFNTQALALKMFATLMKTLSAEKKNEELNKIKWINLKIFRDKLNHVIEGCDQKVYFDNASRELLNNFNMMLSPNILIYSLHCQSLNIGNKFEIFKPLCCDKFWIDLNYCSHTLTLKGRYKPDDKSDVENVEFLFNWKRIKLDNDGLTVFVVKQKDAKLPRNIFTAIRNCDSVKICLNADELQRFKDNISCEDLNDQKAHTNQEEQTTELSNKEMTPNNSPHKPLTSRARFSPAFSSVLSSVQSTSRKRKGNPLAPLFSKDRKKENIYNDIPQTPLTSKTIDKEKVYRNFHQTPLTSKGRNKENIFDNLRKTSLASNSKALAVLNSREYSLNSSPPIKRKFFKTLHNDTTTTIIKPKKQINKKKNQSTKSRILKPRNKKRTVCKVQPVIVDLTMSPQTRSMQSVEMERNIENRKKNQRFISDEVYCNILDQIRSTIYQPSEGTGRKNATLNVNVQATKLDNHNIKSQDLFENMQNENLDVDDLPTPAKRQCLKSPSKELTLDSSDKKDNSKNNMLTKLKDNNSSNDDTICPIGANIMCSTPLNSSLSSTPKTPISTKRMEISDFCNSSTAENSADHFLSKSSRTKNLGDDASSFGNTITVQENEEEKKSKSPSTTLNVKNLEQLNSNPSEAHNLANTKSKRSEASTEQRSLPIMNRVYNKNKVTDIQIDDGTLQDEINCGKDLRDDNKRTPITYAENKSSKLSADQRQLTNFDTNYNNKENYININCNTLHQQNHGGEQIHVLQNNNYFKMKSTKSAEYKCPLNDQQGLTYSDKTYKENKMLSPNTNDKPLRLNNHESEKHFDIESKCLDYAKCEDSKSSNGRDDFPNIYKRYDDTNKKCIQANNVTLLSQNHHDGEQKRKSSSHIKGVHYPSVPRNSINYTVSNNSETLQGNSMNSNENKNIQINEKILHIANNHDKEQLPNYNRNLNDSAAIRNGVQKMYDFHNIHNINKNNHIENNAIYQVMNTCNVRHYQEQNHIISQKTILITKQSMASVVLHNETSEKRAFEKKNSTDKANKENEVKILNEMVRKIEQNPLFKCNDQKISINDRPTDNKSIKLKSFKANHSLNALTNKINTNSLMACEPFGCKVMNPSVTTPKQKFSKNHLEKPMINTSLAMINDTLSNISTVIAMPEHSTIFLNPDCTDSTSKEKQISKAFSHKESTNDFITSKYNENSRTKYQSRSNVAQMSQIPYTNDHMMIDKHISYKLPESRKPQPNDDSTARNCEINVNHHQLQSYVSSTQQWSSIKNKPDSNKCLLMEAISDANKNYDHNKEEYQIQPYASSTGSEPRRNTCAEWGNLHNMLERTSIDILQEADHKKDLRHLYDVYEKKLQEKLKYLRLQYETSVYQEHKQKICEITQQIVDKVKMEQMELDLLEMAVQQLMQQFEVQCEIFAQKTKNYESFHQKAEHILSELGRQNLQQTIEKEYLDIMENFQMEEHRMRQTIWNNYIESYKMKMLHKMSFLSEM